MGGSNNIDHFDELFILHTSTWLFSKVRSESCPFGNFSGLTVTSLPNSSTYEAFIFGGSTWLDFIATVSSDVFLTCRTSTSECDVAWKRIGCPQNKALLKKNEVGRHLWPHPRFAHSACVIDDRFVLVHGGWGFREENEIEEYIDGDDIFFSDFKLYNIDQNLWEDVHVDHFLPKDKRFGHNVFCLNHLDIVVGICGSNGLHPLNDVFVYSFKSPSEKLLDTFVANHLESDNRAEEDTVCGLLGDFYKPVFVGVQFQKLLQSKLFHDVEFVVSGHIIPAHKCILAAKSAVFLAMFSSDFQESFSDGIHVENTSSDIFESFIRCLYGEDVRKILCFDNLLGILKLANRYRVLDIKYECEVCLCMQVNSTSVISLFCYADEYACPYILRRCIEYVAQLDRRDIVSELKSVNPCLVQMIQPYLCFLSNDSKKMILKPSCAAKKRKYLNSTMED